LEHRLEVVPHQSQDLFTEFRSNVAGSIANTTTMPTLRILGPIPSFPMAVIAFNFQDQLAYVEIVHYVFSIG
jgi:hypothetical protein